MATESPLHVPDLIASVRNINAAYLEWKRILAAGHARRQQQSIGGDAETRLMRWYEPELVPGLLQTRHYAEAVLKACIDMVGSPDDLEAAVDARMQRQSVLYEGVHQFSFLIGEQTLYTTVGDDAIMLEQMTALMDQFDRPRLSLGVIPRTAQFQYPTTNFVMFDQRLVQVETVSAELNITQPRELALYDKTFRALARQAVVGSKARALITTALELRANEPNN